MMVGNGNESRFGIGSGGPIPGDRFDRQLRRTYLGEEAPLAGGDTRQGKRSKERSERRGHKPDPDPHMQEISPGVWKWV